MTTVIHHSADFDGLFCREIARKFLPTAELIGWDYKDDKLPFPAEGRVYVLDLSPQCFVSTPSDTLERLIWIDHHKSAIEDWPATIPGYRIDGVAACRLAWQWFAHDFGPNNPNCREHDYDLPQKEHYVAREVSEPLAVRLAGEYDVRDHKPSNGDDLAFQLGLSSRELTPEDWRWLLMPAEEALGEYSRGQIHFRITKLLQDGKLIQSYVDQRDAAIVSAVGFVIEFEGLKFLALNTASKGSLQFAAGLNPEHDACFGFKWTGKKWSISLYHAPGKEQHDLSLIAVKHGGGGHRGACGFTTDKLPFM